MKMVLWPCAIMCASVPCTKYYWMEKKMKVTQSKLVEVCNVLGVNPNDVCEVHMYAKRVQVEVYVHGSEGVRYLNSDENGYLTTTLDYTVVNDEDETDGEDA